jgi:hypothetical protein
MTTAHGDDAQSAIKFVKSPDDVYFPTSKDYVKPENNQTLSELISHFTDSPKLLPSILADLLENPKIKQILPSATPKDLQNALELALKYKQKIAVKSTRDERIYKLSKLLVKHSNK